MRYRSLIFLAEVLVNIGYAGQNDQLVYLQFTGQFAGDGILFDNGGCTF